MSTENKLAPANNGSVGSVEQRPTFSLPIKRDGTTFKKEYYTTLHSGDPTLPGDVQAEGSTFKVMRGEVFDKKTYLEQTINNWHILRNNDLRDYISPTEFYEEVRKGAIGYRVNSCSLKVSEPTIASAQTCSKTVSDPTIHWNSKLPEPYLEIANVKTPNTILPAYVRTQNENYCYNMGPSNCIDRYTEPENYTLTDIQAYKFTKNGKEYNPCNIVTGTTKAPNLRLVEQIEGGLELACEIKKLREDAYKKNFHPNKNLYKDCLWEHTVKEVRDLSEPWVTHFENPDKRFISIYPHIDKEVFNDDPTWAPTEQEGNSKWTAMKQYFIPLQDMNGPRQNTAGADGTYKPYEFQDSGMAGESTSVFADNFLLPLTIPSNSIQWNYNSSDTINIEHDELKYTSTIVASPQPDVMAFRYINYREPALSAESFGFQKVKLTYEADIEFIYRQNVNTNARNSLISFMPLFPETCDSYLPKAADISVDIKQDSKTMKKNLRALINSVPEDMVFLRPFKRASINSATNAIKEAPTWAGTPYNKIQPVFVKFNNITAASNLKTKRYKTDV